VGTNHRRAGLEFRERLASKTDHAAKFLERLQGGFSDFEAVVLSTCNRFEVVLWRPSHARPDIPDILKLLSDFSDIPLSELEKVCYCYRRDEAARHVFRVVCGMDSMLVGEPQIVGQVRGALAEARKFGMAGTYLSRLVQNGLTLARKVRQVTGIAEGAFSLGSVAAEFADRIFGSLADKSFLVIGAGKMGTSALQRLMANGAREVLIANRDRMKSKTLADSLPGARAIGFNELESALARVDVVITCVSAAEPILTLEQIEGISPQRSGWPMLVIDLGLPRNVEPGIGGLSWVHLYDLDALGHALEKQNDWRRTRLEACAGLIDEAVGEYEAWQQQRTVSPVIVSLRQKIHRIGEEELARLASRTNAMTAAEWALVEKTVHRVIHKILHDPTAAMTQAAKDSRGAVYAGILQKLFDLESESAPTKEQKISHE
jgi:glutamyl-tRNA reductase